MSKPRVVALIPAKNSAGEVGAAVKSVKATKLVTSVCVIDDGSSDTTAQEAVSAGANLIISYRNRGKGYALQEAIEVNNDADIFLLVDADTGKDAGKAASLLLPVINDEADLVVGVLPNAGGKAGFGFVKRFAQNQIRKACGLQTEAPLSGQRAVRASTIRPLTLAPRFGVEVGMTIDAFLSGARYQELPVQMSHRHTGRKLSGFLHRGKQGINIATTVWHRRVSAGARFLLLVVVVALALGIELAANKPYRGDTALPTVSQPVTINIVPGLNWGDVVPNIVRGTLSGSTANGNLKDPYSAIASASRDKNAEALDVGVNSAPTLTDALRVIGTDPGIIVGIDTPGSGERQLRPVLIVNAGKVGQLTSPSTRRDGLIDLTDLVPTALAMNKTAIPDLATGRVATFDPRIHTLTGRSMEARFLADNSIRPWAFAAVVFFGIVGLILVFYRAAYMSIGPAIGLILAAMPLGSYLANAMRFSLGWTSGARSALLVALVGLIVYGVTKTAASPWSALRRILTATVVLLILDLLTGANAQIGGVFGSDPTLGARYYGIGNSSSGFLLVATVLIAVMHFDVSVYKRAARFRIAGLFLMVTAAVALPGLGADVGGTLAFIVTGVVTINGLQGKRFAKKWIAGGAFAAAAGILAAGLFDAGKPTAQQSHLGELFNRVKNEGFSYLVDVVSHKVSANVFAYAFPWSVFVIAGALFLIYALWRTPRWASALPARGTGRIGSVLALGAAFLMFSVNDSGIGTLALVAMYLIPYVMVQDALIARRKMEVTAR